MPIDMLPKVKSSIRISHNKLDEDILDDIQACLSDLHVHGVTYADEANDPLILNAVKLYCKSLYTDDPAKSEKYQQRYEALRDCLKMATGYGRKGEESSE